MLIQITDLANSHQIVWNLIHIEMFAAHILKWPSSMDGRQTDLSVDGLFLFRLYL